MSSKTKNFKLWSSNTVDIKRRIDSSERNEDPKFDKKDTRMT